ncbi:glycoside hydrolase family 76 protein [Actinoplanes sp. NBRC 103695]|uniref:glycoside hydrolase family 76 protein n=1 Tax=Actinoplanes sp. NBRC 103695 TaxID=3032202 RepID=UPI0024A03D35|nr:glycoside hydrolase family 76 protein [Actinoplanes sp. NBRC 103695]GLZ00968.1 hypothetical protein Acsp02_82200 [Actinoplanes sp. NBRC 103695]
MRKRRVRSIAAALVLSLLGMAAAEGATTAPAAAAEVQVCRNGICDGQKDPATAAQDTLLQTAHRENRSIELHVSFTDGGMAWADLRSGAPGDLVWLDRTFDGGATWEGHLGLTEVPAGGTSWRTMMYWISDVMRGGMVRACGETGGAGRTACTSWLPVCRDGRCDGADPAGVADKLPNARSWVWGRKVTMHVSADGLAGWASIDNVDTSRRDVVWLDRSWDGGTSWESGLGATAIPPGRTGWRTLLFHFDNPSQGGVGMLRACGQAEFTPETQIDCTPWVRGSQPPPDIYRGASDELERLYNGDSGMFGPGEPDAGIWISANALTALLDYTARTGDDRHLGVLATMRNKHTTGIPAKTWTGEYYDDYAWWGLAWLRGYDVTRNTTYLALAEKVADRIRDKWSLTCGGGIRWSDQEPLVKNTITNALYLKLAAGLHRRGRGGGRWLEEANRTWDWFESANGGRDLLDASNGLAEDAMEPVNGRCVVTNGRTYTYLQGTMAGGLAELYRVTGRRELLVRAARIMNAATTDESMVRDGVLYYDIEEIADDGDGLKDVEKRYPSDGTAFKGAFMRNLRELYDVSVAAGAPTGDWRGFMLRQRTTLMDGSRNDWSQFGMHWAGPVTRDHNITFGTQLSALDAFNAGQGL